MTRDPAPHHIVEAGVTQGETEILHVADDGKIDLNLNLTQVILQQAARGGRYTDCAAGMAYNAQLERDAAATRLLAAGIPIHSDLAKGIPLSVRRGDAAGASVQMQHFLEGIQRDGLPIDINALVQWVLRESYMQTTWDLRFYAEKVQFYSDVKKQIREGLESLRDLKAKYAGADEGTLMDSGDFTPVLELNSDFWASRSDAETNDRRAGSTRGTGNDAGQATQTADDASLLATSVDASPASRVLSNPPASPEGAPAQETAPGFFSVLGEAIQAARRTAAAAQINASAMKLDGLELSRTGQTPAEVADDFLHILELQIGQWPPAVQEGFFASLKQNGGLWVSTTHIFSRGNEATDSFTVDPNDYGSLQDYLAALVDECRQQMQQTGGYPSWKLAVNLPDFTFVDPAYREGMTIGRSSSIAWSSRDVSGSDPTGSTAITKFVDALRTKIAQLPGAGQQELFLQLAQTGLSLHGFSAPARAFDVPFSTAGYADWETFFTSMKTSLENRCASWTSVSLSAAMPEDIVFFDRENVGGGRWRETNPGAYYARAETYGAGERPTIAAGQNPDADPSVGAGPTIKNEIAPPAPDAAVQETDVADPEIPAITGSETERLEIDLGHNAVDGWDGFAALHGGIAVAAVEEIIGTGGKNYNEFIRVIEEFLGQFLLRHQPMTPEKEQLLLEQFRRQPISIEFETVDNPNHVLGIQTDAEDSYGSSFTSALTPKPNETLQAFLGRVATDLGRQAISYVRDDANDGGMIDIGVTSVSADMPTIGMMTAEEAEAAGYFTGGTGIGRGDSDSFVSQSGLAEGEMRTVGDVDAEIKRWEEELSSVGDDAQLANIDLQNMLQKQQQTLQMISNISKTLHDTAMSIIRNLNG